MQTPDIKWEPAHNVDQAPLYYKERARKPCSLMAGMNGSSFFGAWAREMFGMRQAKRIDKKPSEGIE